MLLILVKRIAKRQIPSFKRTLSQSQSRVYTLKRIFLLTFYAKTVPFGYYKSLGDVLNTKKIILILDMNIFHSMELVSGVEDSIKNLNWDIFPIFYDKINLLSKLIEKDNIDGVIGSFAGDYISCLSEKSIAAVNISSVSKIDKISSVLNDNHKTGEVVAEHFYNNNLKHLYFCGQKTFNYSRLMRAGYMKFSKIMGLCAYDTPPFFITDNSEKILQWLSTIKKPSGIFCTNSIIARSIIKTAQNIKLKIPDDISIVVWNGTRLDSLLSGIELSTISPNSYEQGIIAVQMLNHLFANPTRRFVKHIQPKDIHIGLSSSYIAGKDPKYAQAYTYILNNFHSYINIDEIAKNIGVSRRKLELVFKKESNISPYQTIIQERIKKAKHLLKTSDCKIIEIADLCGFSEQRQLSVTFKNVTGISPKKFREKENKLKTKIVEGN